MFNKILWGGVTLLDVIKSILILFITVILVRILTLYIRRLLKDRVDKDQVGIITKVVSYSIIFIALISILPHLGIPLRGLTLTGGIVGIILGFASQTVVSNFISGIFLIIEKPLKIGDQVEIDGVTGFVEDVRIISTTLRTYEGIYVRIPNNMVFTTKLTNFTGNIVRRFEYSVGIRYSDDASRAIELIKELINGYSFALVEPAPQVFVDNLGDNAVNIAVRVWAPVSQWYSLKMVMLWDIKAILEKNGIEIAFPQRTLWFANPMDEPGKKTPSDPDNRSRKNINRKEGE
jgi:small-conductance mechanosensitive channel